MILLVLAIGRAAALLNPHRTLPDFPSATAHALAVTNGGPLSASAATFGGNSAFGWASAAEGKESASRANS